MITPGVAPSAPVNGEIWATTSDLQVRLNGVTETVAEQSWVTAQGYITSAPVTSVAGRTGAITLAVADVSGAAPLASPTFSGTPSLPTGTTAVTQTAGNNTTAVATTAFVAAAIPTNNVKAWVCFNGTGTPAINAQSNVSSITDNGVGDYTVNFTASLADNDYAVTGSGQYAAADNYVGLVVYVRGSTTAQNYKLTTSVRIIATITPSQGTATVDSNDVSVVITR
jgi:hypothetical protein